jgi:hypothetical protein
MPNETDARIGRAGSVGDRLEQLFVEDVRAVGVAADAGGVGGVADAPEPRAELGQVHVGAEETGDGDDGFATAAWDAEAPEDGGCAQP